MGRRKLDSYLMVLTFMVIAFFILRSPDLLGLNQASANSIFALMPAVFLMIFSICGIARTNGAARFGSTVAAGLSGSWLLSLANDQGIVTPDLLKNLTVPQAQVWIIVIGAIIGVVISR